MPRPNKEKLSRIVHIMNGLLFIMAAFSLFGSGKWLFISILLATGLLNLAQLPKKGIAKYKVQISSSLFIANALVCFATAYDNYAQGKDYVQYVWILAALLSLFAWYIKTKKPA